MNILLTGGAGYIGSHTSIALLQAGYEVVLLDNFCNSQKSVLGQLEKIVDKTIPCVECDVRDTKIVTKTLQDYKIDAVIHFAGLKAVGESVEKPIEYYANNVQGTINLLEAMKSANTKTLVFSSSATVYGNPQYLPIDENHPTSATNAYGRSKLHIEEMLKDVANSDLEWKIVCLRYFNPVGAHESGLIGENPVGVPNNLMPTIAKVIEGKLHKLNIFGNDYDTKDGTGVRDYIHVVDLAMGHVAAIRFALQNMNFNVFNLGTGQGYSVLEMITAFEHALGESILFEYSTRRPGDIAACFADVRKAREQLDWSATRNLNEMCLSLIKWHKEHYAECFQKAGQQQIQ